MTQNGSWTTFKPETLVTYSREMYYKLSPQESPASLSTSMRRKTRLFGTLALRFAVQTIAMFVILVASTSVALILYPSLPMWSILLLNSCCAVLYELTFRILKSEKSERRTEGWVWD